MIVNGLFGRYLFKAKMAFHINTPEVYMRQMQKWHCKMQETFIREDMKAPAFGSFQASPLFLQILKIKKVSLTQWKVTYIAILPFM